MKMTTEHLKRAQAIAEKTGGKGLAAALASAIARRAKGTKRSAPNVHLIDCARLGEPGPTGFKACDCGAQEAK